MTQILYALLFLLVPASIIWLSARHAWASKVGVIVLCYIAGMACGNLGLIPASVAPLQTQITDLSIALAMPLLLFTLDLRQWRQLAGRALLSMLLATTAVVTLATLLFALLRDIDPVSASHYAAMSVGVYTGGTPNLAAIKTGLDIPHSEYIVFHSLDTLVGSAYLLLMLTVGIRLFRRLLVAAPDVDPASARSVDSPQLDADDYSPLLLRQSWPQALLALGLALLVVAAAWLIAGIYGQLTGSDNNSAVLIVLLTSLGILLSLLRRVRALVMSYKLGMYLIYVFCFVVASMAQLEQLLAVDWQVALFLLGTVFGSLLLHGIACRLLRIDSDTFMVTSVAAVCSPPFVPMMARALNNPPMILSGMTTGIIGYALGNYLGITLGLMLQAW